MKKKIKLLLLFLLPLFGFSQSTFYEMPNGKIVDLETYNKIKLKLSEKGKVEETTIKTINRNDSIIKTTKFTILVSENNDGNYFDPYSKFKEKIGNRFPIEEFKNKYGKSIDSTEFNGKPTLINFWFTKCAPCVQEIPILNEIEEKLNTKVNFLAITFNTNKEVNEFIVKKPLNFIHLTENKSGIDKLEIVAYPMSLIIDKEGKIVDVFGEISFDKNEILAILNKLL